jgi:hypothetical protein
VSHDAATLQATLAGRDPPRRHRPALAASRPGDAEPPDINKQSLAGAVVDGDSTGRGRAFKALHGDVVGFRIATPGAGACSNAPRRRTARSFRRRASGSGFGRPARRWTLQNAPLVRVKKRVEPRPLDEVMAAWPTLVQTHRNVEFFALPFTGIAAAITVDPTDEPVHPRGPDTDANTLMESGNASATGRRACRRSDVGSRRKVMAAAFVPEEAVDEGWKAALERAPGRFNEMEYHLPLESR